MPTFTDSPSPRPVAVAADRTRARLNRIAPSTLDGAPRRSRRPVSGGGRGFRLGWTGWLLIECAAVVVILGAVIAWPPIDACRDQERKTGFYAGDGLGKCIRRGIAARVDAADQRLKMAIRNSGH